MRLNITNDKPHMIDFLKQYLNQTLLNQKVEAVINGIKYEGTINTDITIQYTEPYYVMTVIIGEEKEDIPLLIDKTRIRIGKTLFFFETERHATIIEIMS